MRGCCESGDEPSGSKIIQTVTFTVHTACVPAPHNDSHHYQCRTPYAAVHTFVLLMMGVMMHETCCDKSLIINIRLVASCWSLSLHPLHPTMRGQLSCECFVTLCVFAVQCVHCCSYFRFRTAGYKSVFGRSCDRPPRHRFFLVSLCL